MRSFNRRRLFAKVSLGAVVALLVLDHFGPPSARGLAAFLTVVGSYVLANWIACRCPGCGRFIGYRGLLKGIPRGAPCEAETRNIERLSWPDA